MSHDRTRDPVAPHGRPPALDLGAREAALECGTLTMTPVERLAKDGVPVDFRFAWDARDPKALAWRTEFSAAGGPWTLVEDYVVRPASGA